MLQQQLPPGSVLLEYNTLCQHIQQPMLPCQSEAALCDLPVDVLESSSYTAEEDCAALLLSAHTELNLEEVFDVPQCVNSIRSQRT